MGYLHAFFFAPVTTNGHVYGCLPALPPEHLWGHLVPEADLGGGERRGAAGPLHCLHMLLLRECCSPAGSVGIKPAPLKPCFCADAVDRYIDERHCHQWSCSR